MNQTEFEKIAIIGKYQSNEVAGSVGALSVFLRTQGYMVFIELGTASAIGMGVTDEGFPVATFEEIGQKCDLALVLGGDGTLLNVARRLAQYDVPLVGVNQGRLGFLTDIGREEATVRVPEILRGEYIEEKRFMLAAEVLRGSERMLHTQALNDVVLSKGVSGQMIEFDLLIDGEYVYTQRSDGMIVSTPTGSTAYAVAANGPILHPTVGGIAVVPLCPHVLTARPITLPDSCEITLRLLPPHDASFHFDGQERFDARAGDCVKMWRAPHWVRVLHPVDYSYFAMLRAKLHWSTAPRDL